MGTSHYPPNGVTSGPAAAPRGVDMGSRIKQNPETTFEVYVEVTQQGTSGAGSDPEVRRQFPEDYSDQEVLQTLSRFCFPFYADSVAASQVGQNFTFVLTDIDSKQRFGFCRLSSGAKSCFCILSYLPWFEVFYKLLNILADYTAKAQDSQWNELLETLYTLSVPEPGASVHLGVHSYFTVPDYRELASIPENRNLTEYFVAVDVNNMLHVYASMLYERRILICSSKLSTLTACIHGSSAMLYPMYWQHVYIPVLPPHLMDYCCAPMPYLIGIHASLMEKVKSMNLEDVVLLNVDTNTLETPFDDLQSLPTDVVSALKSRLRKVSTTTGDGVARAFLKAQASLFGSYRSALKIEPEEPITFCEETFVSHRSSGMRPFLQNATQLQLFKQFIDGRLDLLNSGNGFSDVFEDEINMGEYAGSDTLYHQWLFTVRKGSGALLNTMKTRANPAMKTVYKFAKDHAKMGIKEVKNRLKQKDLVENVENGSCVASDETVPRTAPSPLLEKKDSKIREERRPITVHFGQVRPPRPQVPKRPKSNMAVESQRSSGSSPEHIVRPTRHYTVFLSEDSSDDECQREEDSASGFSENFLFSAPFEWPQPYRTLKETHAEGDEMISPEKFPEDCLVPEIPAADPITEVNLLEDIFSHLDVPSSQPLPIGQAKSLEDLRTPKDVDDQRCTFDYQRMDLCAPQSHRIVPQIKHFHPYNKLWCMGQDDMAIPTKCTQSSPERASAFHDSSVSTPLRPFGADRISNPAEKDDASTGSQSNITIPRPQGRKTPELGIVPPPPLLRVVKPQMACSEDPSKSQNVTSNDFVTELMQESFGTGSLSLDSQFSQSLHFSPSPSQLGSDTSGTSDLLQPVKVVSECAGRDEFLRFLDPLKASSWQSSSQPHLPSSLQRSPSPLCSNSTTFAPVLNDFSASSAVNFGSQLAYPPSGAQFVQPSLNPFVQAVPTVLSIPVARPPAGPFSPQVCPTFSTHVLATNPGFYQAQIPQQNLPGLSMSSLFSQVPVGLQVRPLMHNPHSPSQTSCIQAPSLSSIGSVRTFPLSRSGSKTPDTRKGPAVKSSKPPVIPPRPTKTLEPLLLPLKNKERKDPFEDLLNETKQEITPKQDQVEHLREQWETFE
ncbi:DENN domain-containing protein 1A isoform X2 [Ambystoma mexicanum]|uniref:DENN domain-containing protein 1A isoform X2 n=1 Tax=Ambystoma mexicanum TaxID=8296 RepID=UPI0037E966F8